jgi:hypothetical protein
MIGWKPSPFIFVHIPKCAGTSIEQSLLPLVTGRKGFGDLTRYERNHFWLPGSNGLQHGKLQTYASSFPIRSYFKFTIVRNPWDRAVSQIKYLHAVARAHFLGGKSFKDQIRAYCNSKVIIWGHDLGASQIDYLGTETGDFAMDFVGRFEALGEDFQVICDRIGIDPIPLLPHVFNARRKLHYSAFFDNDSIELIERRFARDIEIFGYRFERKSEPLFANKPADEELIEVD